MAAADWPTHDNKEWQKVVDRAYALGWPKPVWTKSHPKLIMQCPAKSPQCTLKAFSTGNGTEGVAKTALSRVERCPHRNVTDAIAKIDQSLDTAERLLDGASTLVMRGVTGERLHDLLDLASAKVTEAARSLEEEFDAADAEHEELTSRAKALIGVEPDETAVDAVTDAASGHLRAASIALADLPKRNAKVEARKERLGTLVARRDALRQALPRTP